MIVDKKKKLFSGYNDSIRSDDDASDDTTMCPKELWN